MAPGAGMMPHQQRHRPRADLQRIRRRRLWFAGFVKTVKHHKGGPVYCRDEIFSALFRTIRRLLR
jgi:hypothetical protein